MRRLLAILAAATILSAQPAPSVQTVFAEGETLDYTVQWMKVTGGTARTKVPRPTLAVT